MGPHDFFDTFGTLSDWLFRKLDILQNENDLFEYVSIHYPLTNRTKPVRRNKSLGFENISFGLNKRSRNGKDARREFVVCVEFESDKYDDVDDDDND